MSDTPMGQGWWQASDSKWYPPEQHPDYRPTLPANAPPPPTPTPAPASSTAAAPASAPTTKASGCATIGIVIALAAGGLLVWAMLNPDEERDSGAILACQHFENVRRDVLNGLLTDEEIRTKSREIHDNARLSDSAAIRNSAQGMLAAATIVDVDAYLEHMQAMMTACRDIDY